MSTDQQNKAIVELDQAVLEAVAAIERVCKIIDGLDEQVVPLSGSRQFDASNAVSVAVQPVYDAGRSFDIAHQGWMSVRTALQSGMDHVEEARERRASGKPT